MTIRTLGALAGVALSAAGVAAAPVWSTELGTPGFSGSYVASFAVHDDGSGEALYATGSFAIPGVPGGSHIARWSGSAWEAVGGGLQNQYSNAMTTFQGDLIVAGYFDTAGNVPGTAKLARWDGQNWNSMDAQSEFFLNSMWDLAVHDDGSGEALYIAGNYVDLNGQVGLDHIARWDGENYTSVGGTIGGAVPLIVLDIHPADLGDGEKLYAAGRFLTIGGVPALNIAVWDGQAWSDMDGGLSRPSGITQVLHMTDWNGDLYVGGRFQLAGGEPVSQNIARWDGSSWHSVGAGFDGDVQELAVFDDGSGETLYAMGNFNNSGSTATPRMARWNGESWEAVSASTNGNIFGAIVYDLGDGPALHMGGGFTSVDGLTSNRVISLLADAGCPADLTGDGNLNFFDVAAFLDLYNAQDPGADWNNDGLINFFDLAAYLDDFNAGCP